MARGDELYGKVNIPDISSVVDVDLELVDDIEVELAVEDQPNFEIFSSMDMEKIFIQYMDTELSIAMSERQQLIKKVETWRRIANNEDVSGREPTWEGASDINVPVVSILLKTATSRLRNTFNGRKPFWSIKPLNKESDNIWIKRAGVLEKYFNIISASRYDLNLYAKNSIIMTDLPIASTVYVRVPWTNLKRNIQFEELDATGATTGKSVEEQVLHEGPELDVIRIEDVLFRGRSQDIQMMPWFSVKLTLSWYEIELYAVNAGWINIDRLKSQGRTFADDSELNDSRIQHKSVSMGGDESSGMVWDIVEFWAYYDVNGDGEMEDVLIYYHKETQTILKATYNSLGMRPIRNIPFYLKPYSIEGGSLVEMVEDLQDEINTMHNLRNDGIHLTESPVWAVNRGSGIRPKEKMFPGKMLFVNNVREDVAMIQNTRQYIETEKAESMDYNYMERATGIQDIAGGFSSQLLKSRDTASSQMLRLQAGSEVFMGIIEGVDLAYQDLAEMLFRQLVNNKEAVIEKERKAGRLSEEEILSLSETLNVDIERIPYALAFKARISDDSETFEGRRQNILSLVTIYSQYVTQILPLMSQVYAGTPIMQNMMQKFVQGATALMEKVFVFFGQEDTTDFMTSSDQIEMINQILSQMGGGLPQMPVQQQGQQQSPQLQTDNQLGVM